MTRGQYAWFTFWMVLFTLLVFFFTLSCDYIRVDDILLTDRDRHEVCNGSHYVDPYTKKEYCFPDGFFGINRNNMHHYLVRVKNDR